MTGVQCNFAVFYVKNSVGNEVNKTTDLANDLRRPTSMKEAVCVKKNITKP